jgi:hypothetical protein
MRPVFFLSLGMFFGFCTTNLPASAQSASSASAIVIVTSDYSVSGDSTSSTPSSTPLSLTFPAAIPVNFSILDTIDHNGQYGVWIEEGGRWWQGDMSFYRSGKLVYRGDTSGVLVKVEARWKDNHYQQWVVPCTNIPRNQGDLTTILTMLKHTNSSLRNGGYTFTLITR